MKWGLRGATFRGRGPAHTPRPPGQASPSRPRGHHRDRAGAQVCLQRQLRPRWAWGSSRGLPAPGSLLAWQKGREGSAVQERSPPPDLTHVRASGRDGPAPGFPLCTRRGTDKPCPPSRASHGTLARSTRGGNGDQGIRVGKAPVWEQQGKVFSQGEPHCQPRHQSATPALPLALCLSPNSSF